MASILDEFFFLLVASSERDDDNDVDSVESMMWKGKREIEIR